MSSCNIMKCLLFYLLLVLTSCTSVKTTFNDSDIGLPKHAKKMLLEKLDGENIDKSVVVFTARFDNDTIKIINNKEVVFEVRVETDPITGLSALWVISNETPVEIQILRGKLKKIPLKLEHLKKYKFVYISRNPFKKNRYTLEYSNNWKGFM